MGCNKKALVALIGSVFMAGATQVLGGSSASMMANTCAGCHGTNGQSAGPAIHRTSPAFRRLASTIR